MILVAWCLGIAASLDRIESSLTREELGRARPGWEQLGPLVLDSWLGLWIWLLVGGALAGLVYWYLGGWWFRLRVRWSGDADAARSAARLVMVYSAFVYSGPVVLMLIIQTLMYPNYGVAYENDLITPLIVAIFSFWSIGTSYIGVRSTFAVSLWKAKVWFIVLPLVFSIAVFGVAIALYEIMSGQPSP